MASLDGACGVPVRSDPASIDYLVRRGKEEWEGTVDALPELIFLVDVEDRVLRCNSTAAAFLRRDFTSVAGRSLRALFAERAARDLGVLAADRADLVCDDPQVVLAVERHAVTRTGSPPGCVYVMRDVSELRRLESIAANIDMLNNLGYVLAVVRHEVGNPINAIKTALTVLLERFSVFDDRKRRSYVSRCLDDIARVQWLLEQLRGFTMFEDIVPAPFDAHAFLADMEPWLRAAGEHDGIEVVLLLPRDARAVAVGDVRALRQVLLGLVANAKDALDGRSEPRIEVALSVRPAEVRLEVRDNGCGVAADDLPRVFLPLFTTKPRGTGLGLAVARTMITRMNGTIDMTSHLGAGTCVEIALPACAPVAAVPSNGRKAPGVRHGQPVSRGRAG